MMLIIIILLEENRIGAARETEIAKSNVKISIRFDDEGCK